MVPGAAFSLLRDHPSPHHHINVVSLGEIEATVGLHGCQGQRQGAKNPGFFCQHETCEILATAIHLLAEALKSEFEALYLSVKALKLELEAYGLLARDARHNREGRTPAD
jgi:hypothetical protein